ncbi:MAG TPA: 1-deoxy-D-xylulose-5-phosphate reductoisomerase [Vicinamibacterales bacterium]|nr:1-deoxy-D-xylulose-5-phosphate reductoisomerase [Vicinamibacterales bacterium]
MKNLAILGSTGSIGRSALDVVRAHPDKLRVVGLAAGANADKLLEQAAEFHPKVIAMATEDGLQSVAAGYQAENAFAGSHGLVAVATHPEVDLVLCASSGTAGLEAVLAAIDAGKSIALANKEVLVMAGALVTAAARRRGVSILPVDSEHNAIHQCLHGRRREEIRRIILTASGGPFREMPASALGSVTPAAALQHPTWRMGRKITIDSATLMNKGLEVIEARWLFDLPASRIDVVVHPQSVVHSMVEFIDGSIIAQLGGADMKLPIQYACSYPDRWEAPVARLNLLATMPLEFHKPDVERFPCLGLAYRALEAGPSHAVVLNAANEVAVASYLEEKISFQSIPRVIEQSMDAHAGGPVGTLDEVRELDRWARLYSQNLVRELELKI